MDEAQGSKDSVGQPSADRRVDVLDHGYVALVDTMGDDLTPARCARTSFNGGLEEREAEKDKRLLGYLVRNQHNTPLEFCQVRFYMKLPLFVAAQLVRHRTASINQVSYRYVAARDEFYLPEASRMVKRPENMKQGSGSEVVLAPEGCRGFLEGSYRQAFAAYQILLENELAPEIARIVLPQATYTEWYWQNDLHNTIHFLRLRLDEHAQWETRQYAIAMRDLLLGVFPTALEAAGLYPK